MTSQTKHYLIVGGGLVLAVALAVILYKRYAANSSASQAATDQSNQDALAYLEASSVNSPYGYAGGGSGSTISLAPAGTQQTLAQEIAGIEQEFGFGPPSPPASTPASPASGSPAVPSTPKPSTPRDPVSPSRQRLVLDTSQPLMTLEHEAFV